MAKVGQYVALRDEYLQGASLYDAQRRAEKLCRETGYDVVLLKVVARCKLAVAPVQWLIHDPEPEEAKG